MTAAARLAILLLLTACGKASEAPEPVNVEAGIARSVEDVRAARAASATPLPAVAPEATPTDE